MNTDKDNAANETIETMISRHLDILGHASHGVTELRVFDPFAQVAYADSADAAES